MLVLAVQSVGSALVLRGHWYVWNRVGVSILLLLVVVGVVDLRAPQWDGSPVPPPPGMTTAWRVGLCRVQQRIQVQFATLSVRGLVDERQVLPKVVQRLGQVRVQSGLLRHSLRLSGLRVCFRLGS